MPAGFNRFNRKTAPSQPHSGIRSTARSKPVVPFLQVQEVARDLPSPVPKPAPSQRCSRRTLCILVALQWTAICFGSMILSTGIHKSFDLYGDWLIGDSVQSGSSPKKSLTEELQERQISARCDWTSIGGLALHLDSAGNVNPSAQILLNTYTLGGRLGCESACESHSDCAGFSYNISANGEYYSGDSVLTLCVLIKGWDVPTEHDLWNSELCNKAVVELNASEPFQCQDPSYVPPQWPYFTWRVASRYLNASRRDQRCGPLFLNHLGLEAECHPRRTDVTGNTLACCNRQAGWCVSSEYLCNCEDCIYYVESEPSPLFPGAETAPAPNLDHSTLTKNLPAPAASAALAPKLEVFVIVPGFGDLARLPNLQRSIEWLRNQEAEENIRITCSVYVYDGLVYENLISSPASSFHPCRFVSMVGRWALFLQVVPDELWTTKDMVLLWFDDVAVQPGASLRRMIEIMACNGLSVLSPTYRLLDYNNQRWSIMYQHLPTRVEKEPPKIGVGRRVSFIEWQFTLMTPDSFRCLRSLVDVDINSHGWGLDTSFPFRCPRLCLGSLDETTMYDTGAGSYSNEKAQSEMNDYYRKYGFPPGVMQNLGVLKEPLNACNGHARLSSAQWDTADPFIPPPTEASMPPLDEKPLTATDLDGAFIAREMINLETFTLPNGSSFRALGGPNQVANNEGRTISTKQHTVLGQCLEFCSSTTNCNSFALCSDTCYLKDAVLDGTEPTHFEQLCTTFFRTSDRGSSPDAVSESSVMSVLPPLTDATQKTDPNGSFDGIAYDAKAVVPQTTDISITDEKTESSFVSLAGPHQVARNEGLALETQYRLSTEACARRCDANPSCNSFSFCEKHICYLKAAVFSGAELTRRVDDCESFYRRKT